MNKTLTAAVALVAGLGMAGIAQAQMNPPPGAQTRPMRQAPGTTTPQTQTDQMSSQGKQQVSVSPQQIQQAQQELKSQGLYRGRIDGKMGRETETAISKFQGKHGLPKTAQLDQQTLDQLNGGNASSGGSQTPMVPPTTQNPATQAPTTGTTNGMSGTTPGR